MLGALIDTDTLLAAARRPSSRDLHYAKENPPKFLHPVSAAGDPRCEGSDHLVAGVAQFERPQVIQRKGAGVTTTPFR